METTETNAKVSYPCERCGFIGKDHPNESDVVGSVTILEPLSKSNSPPTDTESGILRKEYEDLSQAITSLDQQIAVFQANMDLLKRKREQCGTRFAVYKSVLHPCRRLPNEVLAIIFGLCVDKDVDVEKCMERVHRTNDCPSTLDTRKSPWVLGQVSGRWRNLILSLPRLWTVIDINWRKGPMASHIDPYVERRLALTLQRAKDRHLSVSWNQASCDRAAPSILFSRSYQWKDASIRAGRQGLKLLTPFSGAFPNLSTLRLHFERDAWSSESESEAMFSIFQDAPALRNLTLSGDSTITPRLRTQFPWSQITRFYMKGSPNHWSHLEIILPLLANVEDCVLNSFRFALPGGPPTTLTRLRSLQILSTDTSSFNNLFQSLTLPLLRKLRARFVPRESIPWIFQFFHRSSCRLEELIVSNVTDDILHILEADQLQGLRTLSIVGRQPPGSADKSYHTVSDVVLGALQLEPVSEGKVNILPRLLRLTLDGTIKVWSDDVLVDMIASRRDVSQFTPPDGVSRLWYLCIAHLGPDGFGMTATATPRMKALVQGGLVLRDGKGRQLKFP